MLADQAPAAPVQVIDEQPEILELEWIRLLPNPLSSQTAEIDMKINWNGVIRVSIVDSIGKTVFTLNFLKKAEVKKVDEVALYHPLW